VLAQAEHLHRSRRHLTIDELEAFHKTQGGLLDRAFMVRQLLEAEWNLDGDDWNELVPARAYLGGMLWPKYDRAAARAPTDPQAEVQMRRLEGVMNLAVFEDIRDVSPRQGWVPPALVSAWLSDTLNRRYGAITLVREGGTIQPEGSDYAKLGTSTALTPETLWCLGWMNHDFTLFKPDLSDAEIQKLIEEDEAATGQTAAPVDDEEEDDERPTRTKTSARSACCSGATGIASSPPGCAPRRTARPRCATRTTAPFAASSSPPTTAARWTSRAGTRPARSSRPTRSPASCACSTCAGA
jgi:hypothetical protein